MIRCCIGFETFLESHFLNVVYFCKESTSSSRIRNKFLLFSSSYQIADLLLSCPDSDVIRSTIDFIMFVIKDETVREHLSKDCSLVESLRSLTAQMNENCKLFHQSILSISIGEIL